jgi:tetratricopeptide (TPR) repeat protein
VRLGRHEFAAAEALAARYCDAHPDDAEAWGLLGDARMERGRSDAAADAYQRMLDLRPGPGAYLRAAFWRERAGDLAGALDLLRRAFAGTGARDAEDRAWILVQAASLEQKQGDAARAEATLSEALALFPEYHYALAALAELQIGLGRYQSGEGLARRALAAAPHPERRLLLADALRGLGREAEAREQESAFEREALANTQRADNENVFLVDFYLDRRPDPARALEIAEREAARRQDPGTLARLARARSAVLRD